MAFSNTCFDCATVDCVYFDRSSLIGSSFVQAIVSRNCTFRGTKLAFSNLANATLSGVSLAYADLTRADISGTNLVDADLFRTLLRHVQWNDEPWFGFFMSGCPHGTRLGGEYQALSMLDPRLGSRTARFVAEENTRWELTQRHPAFAKLWYLSTNSGRSPGRILFWIFFIWASFGTLFAGYPLPSFLEGTPMGSILCDINPEVKWNVTGEDRPATAPYIFSILTMMNTNFGDVEPEPSDLSAQIAVVVETFLGYLILAMFVALLMQNITAEQAYAGNRDFSPNVDPLDDGV
ncbi:MAG: pentapeptide repeat-containing protein [Ignavibacteriae bacterium]|nr:pentapeptide repeat-containing protein [Ignavibacteriota bacterium]